MSAWEPRNGSSAQGVPGQPAKGVSTDLSATSAWRRERPVGMIVLPDPESPSGWSNHRVMADEATEEEEPRRIGFTR